MGAKMQPIRDMAKIDDIQTTLSGLTDPHGQRLFLMFEVGIRLGLRVGDLLQLRVGDIRGKTTYTYRPKKQLHKGGGRGVTITATIEPTLRKIMAARCADKADTDYLFASRKSTKGGNPKPITRQQAYHDLRDLGKMFDFPMGCHTLRKTFGYHHYKKHQDIAFLQEWFGHSSSSTTLIYIGMTEDNFRKRTDNSPFGLPDGVRL